MSVRAFYKRNPWIFQAALIILVLDFANYWLGHRWLSAEILISSWVISSLSLMLSAVASRFIEGKSEQYRGLKNAKSFAPTLGGMGLVHLARGDKFGVMMFLALPHAALLYFFLYALWTAEPTPKEAESTGIMLNSQHL